MNSKIEILRWPTFVLIALEKTCPVLSFDSVKPIESVTKPSPTHAPQSNGTTERLMQKHWPKARVFLMVNRFPKFLWPEAFQYCTGLETDCIPQESKIISIQIVGCNYSHGLQIISWIRCQKLGFHFLTLRAVWKFSLAQNFDLSAAKAVQLSSWKSIYHTARKLNPSGNAIY